MHVLWPALLLPFHVVSLPLVLIRLALNFPPRFRQLVELFAASLLFFSLLVIDVSLSVPTSVFSLFPKPS